jgi:fatty acid desaturase
MALYGGPYLVINAWLVLYTWLQHTDVDVPHFSDSDHTYVRGALHTIDRPYDKLDPWGAIDFLHHKIGSTHVAHHFDSSIPHYNAQKATDAIKDKFPDLYLYEPTPIFEAFWRVCKGCAGVKKEGDKYIWNNDGMSEVSTSHYGGTRRLKRKCQHAYIASLPTSYPVLSLQDLLL